MEDQKLPEAETEAMHLQEPFFVYSTNTKAAQ